MIRAFRCDLHVHTCLSPCAELDMSPRALARRAVAERLDLIAITDHNASENVPHVLKAACHSALAVLPGMEVTSAEEVHLLALFETLVPLARLQDLVYAHLPGLNDERQFGCQPIVNERDEVEGFNERLLIGATDLAMGTLIDEIHALGGLAVASHIDREAFSVLSQLGFVHPASPFDALEVSRMTPLASVRAKYPDLVHHAFLASSDAHRLDDIGKGYTEIRLERPTLAELRLAFAESGGRGITGV
jgi:hypothetical protein